ncbi:MAG: helix-turn-helix domain-containing protein [Calditrichia bacterium]
MLNMNIFSKHALGSKIKLVIKNSPFTQKVLAKDLKITETTLSNYVAGRRLPDAQLVAGLAKLCNVSLNWLLLGEGDMSLEKSIHPAPHQEFIEQLKEEVEMLRAQNNQLLEQLINLTSTSSKQDNKLKTLEKDVQIIKQKLDNEDT